MFLHIIQDGIGQGGPIEGFDISVYHVETDFILGYEVDGKSTFEKIWPVCHPKVIYISVKKIPAGK